MVFSNSKIFDYDYSSDPSDSYSESDSESNVRFAGFDSE